MGCMVVGLVGVCRESGWFCKSVGCVVFAKGERFSRCLLDGVVAGFAGCSFFGGWFWRWRGFFAGFLFLFGRGCWDLFQFFWGGSRFWCLSVCGNVRRLFVDDFPAVYVRFRSRFQVTRCSSDREMVPSWTRWKAICRKGRQPFVLAVFLSWARLAWAWMASVVISLITANS